MSKQIRIYSNNRVFNYSLSWRELEPERVDDEMIYNTADQHINIYLPDTESALPGSNMASNMVARRDIWKTGGKMQPHFVNCSLELDNIVNDFFGF